MPWLLLLNRAHPDRSRAVRLVVGDVSPLDAGIGGRFELRLKPNPGRDVQMSAEKAGRMAYQALSAERLLPHDPSRLVTPAAPAPAPSGAQAQAPRDRNTPDATRPREGIRLYVSLADDGLRADGNSIDLLFALTTVTTLLAGRAAELRARRADGADPGAAEPYPAAFADYAATGVLDDDGYVQPVDGLAAKLNAAIAERDFPDGAIIFYPKGNSAEIDAELERKASARKLELVPVERWQDAAAALGVHLDEYWPGNPWCGLDAYGYAQRKVFFCRGAESARFADLLQARARAGRPSVLIVAGSGIGKSSLAQAGILPEIEARLGGAQLLAHMVWRPSQARALGRDEAALAASLAVAWAALPCYRTLRNAASATLEALAAALGQPPAGQQPLWVLDQLEELFALDFAPEAVAAFCAFVQRVQRQGAWIVATLLADYYSRYQRSGLLASFGNVEATDVQDTSPVPTGDEMLQPIGPAALRAVIDQPARRAGLFYEPLPAGGTLADRIFADALATPDVLLLSFALDQLYRRREGGNLLTVAAYDALGTHGAGLAGAIGDRAEAVWTRLDAQAQAQLPRMLRALVHTAPREGEPDSPQPVELGGWSAQPPLQRLIEALVGARLLLVEEVVGSDGVRKQLRVRHHAVLTHWRRAATQLDDQRDLLRQRDRLAQRAREWSGDAQRADELLVAYGDLLAARQLKDALGMELHTAQYRRLADYIDASLAGETKRQEEEAALQQRELERARRGRFVAVTMGAIFAMLALGLWWQWQRAADSLREATLRRVTSDSLDLLIGSKAGGDDNAIRMLVAVHRMQPGAADVGAAMLSRLLTLDASEPQHRRRAFEGTAQVRAIAVSPDGQRIVSGSSDNTLRLWDAASGEPIGAPLRGHTGKVNSSAFSPDGRRIVSGSSDNNLRLWDAVSGEPIGAPLQGHTDWIQSVAFSPDGRSIVSGSGDRTLRLWDAASGAPIGAPLQVHIPVTSVAFSPDGRSIVSATLYAGTLTLWDAASGERIRQTLPGHMSTVSSVAFSPDGRRIVSASFDNTLRLWDAASGALIGAPLQGHSPVTSVAFSPDGRHIVSGSWDGTLRVWNAARGEPIGKPMHGHMSAVTSVAFSPDGRRIASGSFDNTLRLWDATTRAPIGAPLHGRTAAVTSLPDLLCGALTRNFTQEEWLQYMDRDLPYTVQCPDLPVPAN